MQQRNTMRLFYGAIVFVALTSIFHILVDVPDTLSDLASNIVFLAGVIALILMTVFVLRPLRERANLLETVLTSANDVVVITTADVARSEPQIIYVNEAFTQLTGYSAEEVIGRSPKFLQGEQTSVETRAAIREALAAGNSFKGEILNYSKSGTSYWLDISIVPVRNIKGQVTHFAAIERDITALKKTDRDFKEAMIQLKRANLKSEAAARDLQESLKKEEDANRAKSNFLANMSHELRTPMNGVLGMAQLLADTTLTNEQRDFVSTINGSGENLLMLLNDILDFSKIEAGALVLENISFNLRESITQAVNLLSPQADKKHIDLRLHIDPDVPNYILGDPGRLRQIIINLIGNAIKFTDHGHVALIAKMQENDLYISVEDTGTGIPAHKIGEIFEKFTQADASVTRKYGGTGLGLAITKQLVALMRGEIGVESAEGKGSTFWFSIPCTVAAAPEKIVSRNDYQGFYCQAVEHLKPVSEAKILLVEDYPVNQVFAEKLLRKFGFQKIDLAENGIQAIEKYRTNVYDMIFMDCQMPELDGYQTTEKLRLIESDTTLHTPIVAMTANAMMGDREKCLKAGMDDYLSKPLRAEHVKNMLAGWFMLDEMKSVISIEKKEVLTAVTNGELPVDMEQLRLFTDGDPEEEKALFSLFLEQAQEMIDLLKQSVTSDKNAVWKSAAHRFKGSSGNLGANKLHSICKRAEAHFEDDVSCKKEMLAEIEQEMQHVQAFLNGYQVA